MTTGRIAVHPIEVRGQSYTVQLDEDGIFHACDEAATSDTRQGLFDTLTKATRPATSWSAGRTEKAGSSA